MMVQEDRMMRRLVPRIFYSRMGKRSNAVQALLFLLVACGSVGTEPLPGQPPHHVAGGFRNTDPEFRRPSSWTRWSFVVRRLWTSSISAAHIRCAAHRQ